MDLLDLPLLGRKFTWFKPNSGEVSKFISSLKLILRKHMIQLVGVSKIICLVDSTLMLSGEPGSKLVSSLVICMCWLIAP